MGKIKKFKAFAVRKLSGGKDPTRLVEEFINHLGHDPDECIKENDIDSSRWMVDLGEGEELEILAESLKTPTQTTIYMGVNVAVVALRGAQDMITAALEIADGLVGIKVSLVGHYLVLSTSLGAVGASVDDLDYGFKLITAQTKWFKDALADELDWDRLPEE